MSDHPGASHPEPNQPVPSLVEHPAEEPRTTAPAPDEQADATGAIEDQQRQGWPDEPTTS